MRNEPHPGITTEIVAHVLEHWLIRGVRTDERGRQSMCYISFVPGMTGMARVAVSMDDERIINAFQDRTATLNWNKGNMGYFVGVYGNLEVRNEGIL